MAFSAGFTRVESVAGLDPATHVLSEDMDSRDKPSRAIGGQPHRSDTFTLQTNPLFVEKVRGIVGLYMAPPERRSRDYTRHSTLSLFAALETATGKVVGRCVAPRREREFRAF